MTFECTRAAPFAPQSVVVWTLKAVEDGFLAILDMGDPVDYVNAPSCTHLGIKSLFGSCRLSDGECRQAILCEKRGPQPQDLPSASSSAF